MILFMVCVFLVVRRCVWVTVKEGLENGTKRSFYFDNEGTQIPIDPTWTQTQSYNTIVIKEPNKKDIYIDLKGGLLYKEDPISRERSFQTITSYIDNKGVRQQIDNSVWTNKKTAGGETFLKNSETNAELVIDTTGRLYGTRVNEIPTPITPYPLPTTMVTTNNVASTASTTNVIVSSEDIQSKINLYSEKRVRMENDDRYASFLKGEKILGVDVVPTAALRRQRDIQEAIDKDQPIRTAAFVVAISLFVSGVLLRGLM